MNRATILVTLAGAAVLGGCGPTGAPEQQANRMTVAEAEPETINIPQTVTEVAPGTTPMAQRTAVIRILNKRNGERQVLTMRPGQALRWGDVVVRLRACETTAPWEVQRLTGGRGVDVVLDMVGGDYLPRNLLCLAEEGRHVSIAMQRGARVELPLWTVMSRRLTLTGSTLRARSPEFKALLTEEIARVVWPDVEAGRLKPVIDTTFPLEQAAEAHRRMESGDHVGKIVLTVGV